MADRTDNILRAAIRSLEQVVAPAISDVDPLAREQATLIASHLRFLQGRIEYQYDRSRFEATYYLKVAKAVLEVLERHSCTDQALQISVKGATSLLGVPGARPGELERTAAALRGSLSRLARCTGQHQPDAGLAVEKVICESADEILQFQRAWFLPQGWDPDEAAVPPLESLLPSTGLAGPGTSS